MATGSPSPQSPSAAIRYRRSATRLTAGQLRYLRDAFAAVQGIGDDRGYAYHAGIHGLPQPIGCDNAHGTPYFLPWHRAYLYSFELAVRDRVRQVSLPWWDWRTSARRPAKIPRVYAEKTVGRKRNALYDAEISRVALQQGGRRPSARTRRRPGAVSSLPTVDEVRRAMRARDFLDFSDQLESLHDRVHMWVGGDMSDIAYAAFDPIFWGHHCMIDRLWRLWQLSNPGARPPAALLDEALPPFRMTVRQTLDTTALGYDYAVASSAQAAS